MQENKTRTPNKSGRDGIPPAMMVVILLTVLIAIVLTVVLLARDRSADEPTPEEPTTAVEPGSVTDEPTPDLPVFAGGSYATLPALTPETASIGEGIGSSYAALVNAETGEVLAGKQANERFSPASMTKVMTLLVICERIKESDLSGKVQLSADIYNYVHPSDKKNGYYGAGCWGASSSIGDEMTLKDALYGIGVSSHADCAVMAMHYLTDSEETFVDWMNEEAANMGLKNTHFDNIIGYESAENYIFASSKTLVCSPLRPRITGARSWMRLPGSSARMRSTIWSMLCCRISRPHWGQWGTPTRAQSRRR